MYAWYNFFFLYKVEDVGLVVLDNLFKLVLDRYDNNSLGNHIYVNYEVIILHGGKGAT